MFYIFKAPNNLKINVLREKINKLNNLTMSEFLSIRAAYSGKL